MPRLGFKCFVGSFLLSLAAVFVATKAYLVMSLDRQDSDDASIANVRSIELFAANEANDPLYDKFRRIEKTQDTTADNEAFHGISDETAVNQISFADEILYAPEDEDVSAPVVTAEAEEMQSTAPDVSSAGTKTEESEYAQQDVKSESAAAIAEKTDDNELKIASADTAPVFKIPLLHHFDSSEKVISVANRADNSQIAMGSHNVSLHNLGTENQAAVTEQLENANNVLTGSSELSTELSYPQMVDDDPWQTAQTSNKHINKNSIDAYPEAKEIEIAAADIPTAPAPETATDAESEKAVEQPAPQTAQVPYKMQKNILIPIPEEIVKEGNLTPQLSSSKENLRLEEQMRARHELPELSPEKKVGHTIGADGERDFEDGQETSKSVSDSISEWFSGSKEQPKKEVSGKKTDGDVKDDALFKKLLGEDAKTDADDKDAGVKEIRPTELKLSFQPNRAEISGQTLDWLHAFADNALNNEYVMVEIRISKAGQSPLQDKRLKLLYKILASNGVNHDKINVIFTDREPNSFIIRNVRYASEEDMIKALQMAGRPVM